jgi:hypothetical protein
MILNSKTLCKDKSKQSTFIDLMDNSRMLPHRK